MTNQSYPYQSDDHSAPGFLMGLLGGLALGVGVGMLLAPKTGADLRQSLSETARKASDSLHQAQNRVRETADQMSSRAKDAASQASSKLRDTAENVASRVKDTAEAGRDGVNRQKDSWTQPTGNYS